MSRQTADRVLRRTCGIVGVDGASTHSWRRSSLTSASNQGIRLRHLQRLSGHASLDMLSRYFDVTDAQLRAAALAFLQYTNHFSSLASHTHLSHHVPTPCFKRERGTLRDSEEAPQRGP